MSSIDDVLRGLLLVPGATYSCAALRATGERVAEAGGETVDPAAVVRWARSAADLLDGADDALDDLMITSRHSYRLVRPVEGPAGEPMLLLMSLDRARANLAVARWELGRARPGAPPAPTRPTAGEAPPPAAESISRPATAVPTAPVALPRRVPSATPPPAPRPPTASRRPGSGWPSPVRSYAPPPAVTAPPWDVPLPRPRPPVAVPAPRAEPPSPAPETATRWADDVGTMRRLLAGLRSLR